MSHSPSESFAEPTSLVDKYLWPDKVGSYWSTKTFAEAKASRVERSTELRQRHLRLNSYMPEAGTIEVHQNIVIPSKLRNFGDIILGKNRAVQGILETDETGWRTSQ